MDLVELTSRVEEVSEQYGRKHGFRRDDVWFLLKLQEEVGELTQAFLARSGQARTKGRSAEELDQAVGSELADVLAHVMLMAHHLGFNLDKEVDQKWLSWTRVETEGSETSPGREFRGCERRAGDR